MRSTFRKLPHMIFGDGKGEGMECEGEQTDNRNSPKIAEHL
jgi:hypothetical protein